MKSPNLQDKRVLVTGASGGIGAGMAKAFAAAGCRVVVHWNTREAGSIATQQAIEAVGGQAERIQADLRQQSAIGRLMDEASVIWDGIDILVNNAGVVLKSAIVDADATQWDNVLNVNLRAPYLLSRAAATTWIDEQRPGVILNNSSIHGSLSAEYFSAYAASKAALESLTRVQALEWAGAGIRVNAIAPGVVPVERQQEALEASKDVWLPSIPTGRYGTAEEIADFSVWLCSDAASWITGQVMVCDGGTLARMNLPKRPKPPAPPPIDR